MSDRKKTQFFEELFLQYGAAVRRYISRRVKTKADVPDLAQEVYLRMLRVSDPTAIRSPQNYLYTVAGNVVKEHAALERRRLREEDAARKDQHSLSIGESSAEEGLESSQSAARLRRALDQLPVRWQTALLLQSRYELTYEEIGRHLGVSSNMVKKYLAKALGRLERLIDEEDFVR
jgi:RNA polymerase sigma-70 factor (ECF subfamily)